MTQEPLNSEIGDREEDFAGELTDIPKLPPRREWPTPSAVAMTIAAEAGDQDTAARIFDILQRAIQENLD